MTIEPTPTAEAPVPLGAQMAGTVYRRADLGCAFMERRLLHG